MYRDKAGRFIKRHLLLNPIQYRIYTEVQHLASMRHGCCFASHAQLAKASGYSVKTVTRHLKKIEDVTCDGKPLLRKHIRNRQKGGRDSNAYEILNLFTGHYNPATYWILEKEAKQRSLRGGLDRDKTAENCRVNARTLSPTNIEQVIPKQSLLKNKHSNQLAPAREEIAFEKINSKTEKNPLLVGLPPAEIPNDTEVFVEKKTPEKKPPVAAAGLNLFSEKEHFEKRSTDVICKDETLILQISGLQETEIQRVLAVAGQKKFTQEQIFDVIQVAFDYKDKILSLSSFLISAINKNHTPNIPRIAGLPPIGPQFTPAELRNLDSLLHQWIDGYSLQRSEYRGCQGFAICIGDSFCHRRSRFIAWGGAITRRAVLEVLAALYARIINVCKRNGHCRDEFGNKKVYPPPCAMVQQILLANQKPDIREIQQKFDLEAIIDDVDQIYELS